MENFVSILLQKCILKNNCMMPQFIHQIGKFRKSHTKGCWVYKIVHAFLCLSVLRGSFWTAVWNYPLVLNMCMTAKSGIPKKHGTGPLVSCKGVSHVMFGSNVLERTPDHSTSDILKHCFTYFITKKLMKFNRTCKYI